MTNELSNHLPTWKTNKATNEPSVRHQTSNIQNHYYKSSLLDIVLFNPVHILLP